MYFSFLQSYKIDPQKIELSEAKDIGHKKHLFFSIPEFNKLYNSKNSNINHAASLFVREKVGYPVSTKLSRYEQFGEKYVNT